jgi:hypothetical protein
LNIKGICVPKRGAGGTPKELFLAGIRAISSKTRIALATLLPRTGWFDAYVKWLGMHGHLKPKTWA